VPTGIIAAALAKARQLEDAPRPDETDDR